MNNIKEDELVIGSFDKKILDLQISKYEKDGFVLLKKITDSRPYTAVLSKAPARRDSALDCWKELVEYVSSQTPMIHQVQQLQIKPIGDDYLNSLTWNWIRTNEKKAKLLDEINKKINE